MRQASNHTSERVIAVQLTEVRRQSLKQVVPFLGVGPALKSGKADRHAVTQCPLLLGCGCDVT